MYAEIEPFHGNESPLGVERMLFVRTDGILDTMIKAPLMLAGLIVVAMAMPTQTSFSSTRDLDLIIYSDGSTHVSSTIDVDPLSPDFEANLFGPSIDNFVAVGENGFLLSSEIIEDKAIIDTFGSSNITIDYDIHDLISKEGRVWTFSFDSPYDYTLLMPQNTVIVGMSALPNNMDVVDEQTKLDLPKGPAEINYIFGSPIQENNAPEIPTQTTIDYTTVALIGGPITAAVIGIAFILKRKQSKQPSVITPEITTEIKSETKPIDVQNIFNYRPEMRDDDKEIVKFLAENGGQVFESELRKKFLQPRTTMWRAVKRLERLGVVEINKKDMQNMVKLKEDLEDEE